MFGWFYFVWHGYGIMILILFSVCEVAETRDVAYKESWVFIVNVHIDMRQLKECTPYILLNLNTSRFVLPLLFLRITRFLLLAKSG